MSEPVSDLPPEFMAKCVDALLEGLTDYTTDERGDVGSWTRISCVLGLSVFIQILFAHAKSLPNFIEYFPPEKYHAAIGGILKQGVERLDNVRQQTGTQFVKLLRCPLPEVDDKERWKMFGTEMMNDLFPRRVPDPRPVSHPTNATATAGSLGSGKMQRGYIRKQFVSSRYRNIAARF